MRTSARLMLMAGLAVLSPAALSQSQPQGEPRREPAEHAQPEPRPDLPDDPAEANKVLARRLEEAAKRADQLREAMKKIEGGMPPREAMREIEPSGRFGPDRRDEPRRFPDRVERRAGTSDRPANEHGPRERVTKEDIDHTMKFLAEHRPTLAARIAESDKARPEMSERGMSRLVPRVREAEEALRKDPKLFELKMQEIEGQIAVVDGIRAFREASNAKPIDQAKLESATVTLREALAKQLDVRISLQVNEIADLTKRLEDLKSDLQKKQSNKESSIDAMMTKIRDFKDRPEGERSKAPPKEGAAPAR